MATAILASVAPCGLAGPPSAAPSVRRTCFLSGTPLPVRPLSVAGVHSRRSPVLLLRPRAAAGKEEGGEKAAKPRMPSAVKRALLSEQRRIRNKSRKSEVKTRMRKAFAALEALKKRGSDATEEELKPVETLIGEAYSAIDKAVKKHTLHRNTGNRRKSRLGRAKRDTQVVLGWYSPESS